MRHIDRDQAIALAAAEARSPEACVLCDLVRVASEVSRGALRAPFVVAENDAAIAWLNRFALRRGHVMVVLKRHVERVAALDWPEYEGVQRLAWGAEHAIERALSPVRVYIAALGSTPPKPGAPPRPTSAVSFPHHHVHVVPLFDGGEGDRPSDVLTWKHGVWLYDEDDAAALAAEISAAWPR